jgi:hypothetical protein
VDAVVPIPKLASMVAGVVTVESVPGVLQEVKISH